MVTSIGGALVYNTDYGRDPGDTARAIGQMMDAARSIALTVVKYPGNGKPDLPTIKKTKNTKAAEIPKPPAPPSVPIIAAPYVPPKK